MSKKKKKKKGNGAGRSSDVSHPDEPSVDETPAQATSGATPPEKKALRRREPKPEKLSPKEISALAKKAARARLLESA